MLGASPRGIDDVSRVMGRGIGWVGEVVCGMCVGMWLRGLSLERVLEALDCGGSDGVGIDEDEGLEAMGQEDGGDGVVVRGG